MVFYKLDYVIEKIFTNQPCREQLYLYEATGREFPKEEAPRIWAKVVDHKWYISERLGRDIGLKVAAVDYLENFYEPPAPKKHRTAAGGWLSRYSRAFNSVA